MDGLPEPEPRVLHESAGVVALDKPPGLATQAPPGIASVESWVRRRMAGPGGYVGVPHRLDRAVSGVLLMAVTPRAARQLSRQFERREVGKHYLALVRDAGHFADAAVAEWRDVVEKVPGEPRARIAAAGAAGGREAVTRARLVARVGDAAREPLLLLLLEPLTGRMHQLRVQAAVRGMPIAGDALYGGPAAAEWGSAPRAEDPRNAAVALHAWRIRYRDPDGRQPVTVEAAPPAAWPEEVRQRLPPAPA